MRVLSRAVLAALVAGALTATPALADTAAAPCDTPADRRVAEVQGSGDTGPLTGQTVRVEGIVTGDFQRTDQLSGFFLQDPRPDADPRTSEGLFVFARESFKDVKTGDRVLVTGKATEFNGWTELSPVTAVDVCGTGSVAAQPYTLPPAADGLEAGSKNMDTKPQPRNEDNNYNQSPYGAWTVSAHSPR
ncbi:endonuclease/exonuclease/phosphatase, partial [Nonomuraea sp. NPDC001023]